MDILEESFFGIYPGRMLPFSHSVKYSGRFSDYNATIQLTDNHMELRLSKTWRGVDRDIVIGLLQELMVKMFRKRYGIPEKTMQLDLYTSFIKNLHKTIPVTNSEPLLLGSFNRVNDTFFLGMIEQPNLVFGSHSSTKLGSYDYSTDTITISRYFEHIDPDLLDYVMYHEMLHKKVKFTTTKGRSVHHSRDFKRLESIYPNHEEMDKLLGRAIAQQKRKRGGWFT